MGIEFKPYPFVAVRHPPHLPTCSAGVDTQRHRVAIVGGGPVGLAVALGLANHGIRSVLLEADDSVCHGSRAICISRRSLEIIERLGALDSFMRVGLPWSGGRSFHRHDEVLHFTMPQDENQKLPPMVNLAQYHIEQFLLDAALRRPELIEIRWQTKVAGVTQHPDGARLDVDTPLGRYALDADWVVASDGGRSTIRDALGLSLQGTSYEGRYVIVDIALDSDRPTERLAYFDPASNPGSTVLVHKQPDNVWRIDYQLRDDEDPEAAVKPENVIPRVQSLLDMMGERGDWSPIWITIYKANALTLERYRHGRVLFCGDAAHLVPIFGVRGANSGIDDADNVAWKLAYAIRGLASDALLDSYSDERVFATHENLRYGTKSTEFMAPPSFAFDLMRKAVLTLAVRHPALRSLINPRQTSAIAYTASPLNADEHDAFSAGPSPGMVLAECPLMLHASGDIGTDEGMRRGHLTDLVGPRFTAFRFMRDGAPDPSFADLERHLHDAGIPFALVTLARHAAPQQPGCGGYDADGRLFDLYGARDGTVYLVRPDGHVLGRWHDARAADVTAALEGALHPRTSANIQEHA
ncbi:MULTISPECIES: FAD-dependent oxidoreductase [unclassified Burkholderia]|uniref:FAD-dependent oxidoreductase n=1 Tax=unclassified Burkholderia TaxID=2613784 RepID=UPI000F55DA2B|nr:MULTISPECIES: FAD-dependent oxidoreductase [unclassified Burkholderia]RQR80352.1 FAD-dependent oxidoreductase [Burkholderia sp. Bp9011]RQR89690.1 FAD-dependent oxidoreductase [Burkholderia sp. Bp9010]RQS74669.1 FAD-dependent oxidoreductase [Burkholderia sp. Bp8977]